MSFRSRCSAAVAIAAALALQVTLSPAPVAAQQDSSMMAHDSAMAMPGDSGMTMSHDSMMDHGKVMDHDTMMKQDGMKQDGMKQDGMGAGANAMMFTGAEGQKAAGSYQLTEVAGKRQLKLTDDFSVTSAPDLYLVLANGSAPDAGALYIGKLKQATGTQTFDLPKGKDLAGYSTLLVWSKKNKRAVASAEWHATSGKMMDHM